MPDGAATGEFNGIFYSVFQACPLVSSLMGCARCGGRSVLRRPPVCSGAHPLPRRYVVLVHVDETLLFVLLSVIAACGCAVLLALPPCPPITCARVCTFL